MPYFVGWFPILAPVMLLSEVEIRSQYLHHGQGDCCDLRACGRCGEFKFQTSFGSERFSRAERAGEQFLLADAEGIRPRELTAAGLLVQDVRGSWVAMTSHATEPPSGFRGIIPRNPSFGTRTRHSPG